MDGSSRNDHSSHAGDIIPAGPWLPQGKNWTPNGIATLLNGCRPTVAADADRDGTPDLTDRDDDNDGTPDAVDPDVDGDGIPNTSDRDFELEHDGDGDGTPDALDPDDDGDGIADGVDPDSSPRDVDRDGVPDAIDPDVDGDCVPNAQDADIDGDGIANAQEVDADEDGVADVVEGEPSAPTQDDTTVQEAILTARLLPAARACANAPATAQPPSEPDPGVRDTDRDGVPDAVDPDDDNDGVIDARDGDADGDGFPETQTQTAAVEEAVTLEDRDLRVVPTTTSAGQRVTTSVRCAPLVQGRSLALGDVTPAALTRSLCGVKQAAGGATSVVARTSVPTRVTVVFEAPATGDDRAFREVRRYVLNPA